MADRRIRIPEDKIQLVDELSESSEGLSPFSLRADALAFAAALGFSRGKKLGLKKVPKPKGDPIRQTVFARQGYDTLINLLAVCETEDLAILADTDEADDKRVTIFEEYANGGLQILRDELKGVVESKERLVKIVQIVSKLRRKEVDESSKDFDVADLIT